MDCVHNEQRLEAAEGMRGAEWRFRKMGADLGQHRQSSIRCSHGTHYLIW